MILQQSAVNRLTTSTISSHCPLMTGQKSAVSDYYISSGSDILSEAHRRMGKENLPGGYEVGAIVVDIIDKKSGEVIYRDFAKREVLDYLTPAEKEQRARDAAVEAVATFFRK